MKVIDSEIGRRGYFMVIVYCKNRLGRILIENGLEDLRIKIGDEIIMGVRNILMNGNSTLRKLLKDDEMDGTLTLCDKCDINSFLEVEKYYSGGSMELNKNSVCGILRFCIYYNDQRIMEICKRYLKKHMSQAIMAELFKILHSVNIKDDVLNSLENISEEYLKMNGFEYLNNEELLLKMNLQCLKFILNNKELIIIDETWLLNRLLKWYKSVFKNNKESEEELNEFISIIKRQINIPGIKKENIEEDNMIELNELDLKIDDYVNEHICVDISSVKNGELIKLIREYYVKENEEIVLDENKIKIFNKNEIKEEMIQLLSNEDIKLIEIILNLIIEMKVTEMIPNDIENKLLLKLLYEYNEKKRNRTLKCLCLFVDGKKHISAIEDLCGKETLYRLLNNEYCLNSSSKELLIKYIQEMRINEKEKEEMSKIINNKDLLDELIIREITQFSYPQAEYLFGLNEEISIIPSFDGNVCEFLVKPPLPNGIVLDKHNGIIHGRVKDCKEKCEYRIKCKNIESEKKFRLSLEFQVIFVELNKNKYISISNNAKLITITNNSWNHCYLNQRIENGIYHIKYKFHQNGRGDEIMLGLSTNNTYSGSSIHCQSIACNYHAYDGESHDITSICHIGTVVNSNPNFNNHGDGSIYEIIVDMNKREFWISHNNSSPVLLVKDLPSPLYPYAALVYKNTSFELLSAVYGD